jgi:hypothetical protein
VSPKYSSKDSAKYSAKGSRTTGKPSRNSSPLRLLVPGLLAAYALAIRPRMLTAGARPDEVSGAFPDDESLVEAHFQATRAIDIDAPAADVWAWIAQIGRGGTGYYGVDALSNKSVPSLAYLRRDLSEPKVGDPMDGGYRIMQLTPERGMRFGSYDLPAPFGSVMEYTALISLQPTGDRSTRLVIRTRGYTYGILGRLYSYVYELIDAANVTAQLRNIKNRAETYTQLKG